MSTAATFQTPNPYAVSSIVDACANRTILATRDIVDLRGFKLWARDQRVSPSLQQRLLDRKLRTPLESCLRAVDGVTASVLLQDMGEFLESPHPLAACVRPHREALEREVQRLPLHSVVQILLTASKEARGGLYQHAVRGMAVAGALAASKGSASYNLRLALLAGLLHDLGEMYIHPQYLDPQRKVDLFGFRQLSAHPRIGSLLLSELTDYPAALALAIDEHHERLDGSGYPVRRTGERLSDLGRLLAVVEAVLGIVGSPSEAPLTRAAFGLGLVPEELDQRWTEMVRFAALHAQETARASLTAEEFAARASQLAACLKAGAKQADLLTTDLTPATVKRVARAVARRVANLHRAWTAAGMWAIDEAALTGDTELMVREMTFRLRDLQRELMLQTAELSAADSDLLTALRNAFENA
jgi:hypothetical protein